MLLATSTQCDRTSVTSLQIAQAINIVAALYWQLIVSGIEPVYTRNSTVVQKSDSMVHMQLFHLIVKIQPHPWPLHLNTVLSAVSRFHPTILSHSTMYMLTYLRTYNVYVTWTTFNCYYSKSTVMIYIALVLYAGGHPLPSSIDCILMLSKAHTLVSPQEENRLLVAQCT